MQESISIRLRRIAEEIDAAERDRQDGCSHADPERPKTWRLLLDTLKRQGEELKRKDTIILAAHQQRDHYRELAVNAANRVRQLEANLEGEKALSAARGKEIERLRAPRKVVISQGRITWYDENGEIQSTAEGDGATMFDLLGR